MIENVKRIKKLNNYFLLVLQVPVSTLVTLACALVTNFSVAILQDVCCVSVTLSSLDKFVFILAKILIFFFK